MAYSLTSAADPKALLAAIITFATAQGWTIEYNAADGTGSTVGGQIALSSGSCHVAIGEQSSSQNPIAVTDANWGAGTDGRLYMALSSSITTSLIQYWGHPDSIVTSATDNDRHSMNDLAGPMSEVHFFGNADYIIVSIRTAPSRWTTFGFGNLDVKGMDMTPSAFAFGGYSPFWNTGYPANSAVPYNANVAAGVEFLAIQGPSIFVPNGICDTSFGFLSGVRVISNTTIRHMVLPLCRNNFYPEQGLNQGMGNHLLDQVMQVRNKPTTGGVALFVCPIIYRDDTIGLQTFLGEIPGIRVCRMTSIAAGAETSYGDTVYKMVPLRQKGTLSDAGVGGTPNWKPNTHDMGYAIIKEV
jgi:hypothetical protein